MLTERKQIVLDKSALVGTSLNVLCGFAEQHFLILPSVLHDECVTNEGKAAQLLDRYERIILAGGFFCPSVLCISQTEAQSLQPYGPLLPDFEGTESWRRGLRSGLRLPLPTDVELTRKEHLCVAKSVLEYNPTITDTLFEEQFQQAQSEIRHAQASRGDRLRKWVRIVDGQPLVGWSAGILECFRSPIDDRLVSNKWVTWHHVRVISVMHLELRFLAESRPAGKVEHDLQDMEYVSLLSRADAVLSTDRPLCDLARAAFPEKDVFSSLEEVPESYRCGWM
jgi:hypothetical protein